MYEKKSKSLTKSGNSKGKQTYNIRAKITTAKSQCDSLEEFPCLQSSQTHYIYIK